MKNCIIISSFFLTVFAASGQSMMAMTKIKSNDDDGDWNRFPQSELFFRCKVLAGFVLEDLWWRSFSAGMEYRIATQFAVSADYVHYRTWGEVEVHNPDNYDDYEEFAQYDARNYWAFQFKWYPPWIFDFEYVQPYISLLYKKGSRKLWNQDGFPLTEGTWVGISGKFEDFGLVLGVLTSGPVGADIALGVRRRDETRWLETWHEDNTTSFQHFDESKYGVVLRANFYVKLFGWNQR